MPSMTNVSGGTVFKPSPYEIELNNKRKKQRLEHEELVKDVAEIKKQLHYSKENKSKSIRRKNY